MIEEGNMSNFKEIVTKAVVGKGKKTTEDTHIIESITNPSTILGCWVINHNFSGVKDNDSVRVKGSFDTNVWYSKDDNTSTEVYKDTIDYEEVIPIKKLDEYDGQDEIMVRVIKQPTVTKAEIKDGKIEYVIVKTIAAELVGDTKIKIGVEKLDESLDPVDEEIEDEVKEDFLN